MPWTKQNYPDSMKNLRAEVRYKAIDIANALLEEENYAEQRAISIGIAKAKEWAENRNKPVWKKSVDQDQDNQRDDR
jgi:uncharacterized protein YdaT